MPKYKATDQHTQTIV